MTTTEHPAGGIGLRRAFLTDDGRLNLVWRIALYALSWWVIFFVGIIVATVVAAELHWPSSGKNAVLSVTAVPLLIGWTWFYRRHVDRRPWRGIGLTALATGLPQMGLGFLAGTILVGAWLLIDLALGWVRVVGTEPAASGLALTGGFLLMGLTQTAGAGFLEETGYRGYVLQNLARQMPVWAAVPLGAFLFAIIVHFNVLTPIFVLFATSIGVLFALTRLATGAIWFGIGVHWAFDGTQGYFFGLSNQTPPYGHSIIHLQLQGWLAASGGHDPVTFVPVFAAIAGSLLWLRRRGQVGWHSRLDDEGRPVTLR